jgi:hypothetical protein
MIAYVFWHRPRDGVDRERYEQAAERFHRSLRRSPPAGFRRSLLLRAAALPWLAGEGWYEDWHLLDDFSALGVLNEAAVAAGHRGSHDQIAGLFGEGAGALYKLLEGRGDSVAAPLAVWVGRPVGARALPLGDMLGDGTDRETASLWRRQLVLGPSPEYCLLAEEPPAGAAATRLPQGWRASTAHRETIFSD